MTTSHSTLMATPQFDGGRWKLRLAYEPLGIAKQFTASAGLHSITRAGTKTESHGDSIKNEATR
jgi:hypothetical protein